MWANSSDVCFRLSRYQQFKDFQKRILVATNLFGRGMDIERVNIVFNYDMPEDSDTYLHRVGVFYRLKVVINCDLFIFFRHTNLTVKLLGIMLKI